jgi:hypothetical protein
MSSHTVRKHGKFISIIISCDKPKCQTSTDDATLKKGGGLRNMGWTINSQGKLQHFCPEHSHENLP